MPARLCARRKFSEGSEVAPPSAGGLFVATRTPARERRQPSRSHHGTAGGPYSTTHIDRRFDEDREIPEALQTLNDFWQTYEIAGVGLVDTEMWHWMYDHPDATPAEVRDAVVKISKDIWNRYYAPVFNKRDVTLLGVYAHMVSNMLYLPDYSIGHLIAHQIEEQMAKAGNIGPEFERMSKIGSVTPDLWMKKATGAPVGAEAMLAATERALSRMGKR